MLYMKALHPDIFSNKQHAIRVHIHSGYTKICYDVGGAARGVSMLIKHIRTGQ